MSYDEELETAKQAARNAGNIIQEYRGKKNTRQKDAWSSAVTDADLEAQQAIVSTLSETFPNDGFLGEEENLSPSGENRVWIIDPLDGTKNYIHDYPAYCTSIALKDKNEYVVGVIYNPVTDTLYHATKDQGAYRDNEDITVSTTSEIGEALAALYNQSVIDKLEQDVYSLRIAGAAALDASYIATGCLDIHVDKYLHEWDVAAAAVLISEAGGTYQIKHGDGERGHVTFAAANPDLFDAVLDTVGDLL